jgi:methylated-DNA-protein-cysteine methyltransferase-like protein
MGARGQIGDAPLIRADSDFARNVRAAIQHLAPGEVVTYGEIAMEAGYPGAARAVGHLLARSGRDLPWWRVVTSTGRLVPGDERRHAALLCAEGVAVRDGHVARPTRASRL